MIEQVVKSIVEKHLLENFPQVQLPGTMQASVTKATKLGDTYDYEDMQVEGCQSCPPYEAKITGPWYEYSLKILTRDGAVDEKYPEIPGVMSRHQVKKGGKVAVAMLYGELRPFILGEVK